MTSQEKKVNIVSLDVGGQIFKTKMETLTKVWTINVGWSKNCQPFSKKNCNAHPRAHNFEN